jgi:hypothetical protein
LKRKKRRRHRHKIKRKRKMRTREKRVSPGSCKRAEYLTQGRVKVSGRSLLGPSFLDKELNKKEYSSCFVLVRVA